MKGLLLKDWKLLKNQRNLFVVNSTPIVRQYGILLTNGVLFYAKRETK